MSTAPSRIPRADDPAPKPTRRTFTAEYKARILAEYEAAPDGERGAVLRRERLYHSHIIDWRAARDAGALAALHDARTSTRRSKKSPEAAELEKLRRHNAKLSDELARTKTALEITGKAHALLEMLSASADTDPTPTSSFTKRSSR
jgi:transposase-like protein